MRIHSYSYKWIVQEILLHQVVTILLLCRFHSHARSNSDYEEAMDPHVSPRPVGSPSFCSKGSLGLRNFDSEQGSGFAEKSERMRPKQLGLGPSSSRNPRGNIRHRGLWTPLSRFESLFAHLYYVICSSSTQRICLFTLLGQMKLSRVPPPSCLHNTVAVSLVPSLI